MFNLLPPKEQGAIRKEYSLRRATLVLAVISDLALASIVFLFSAYAISAVEKKNAVAGLEGAQQIAGATFSAEELSGRLAAAKESAQALDVSGETGSIYELLRIFEKKSEAIKIMDISYSGRAESPTELSLKGRAANRDSLTEFGKNLRNESRVASVDLPISNFAKEKDIDFNMTITVKN